MLLMDVFRNRHLSDGCFTGIYNLDVVVLPKHSCRPSIKGWQLEGDLELYKSEKEDLLGKTVEEEVSKVTNI